ncbi:MAG TPA: universal stress protein [Steroidobacteraceae bacterium]|nr:universal stress protein [Steroidobacteraceae bacterium]
MKRIACIVVVADAGTEQHALARAQEIARTTGATIELVAFAYDSAVADNPRLAARDRRLATQRLVEERRKALGRHVREGGGHVSLRVVWTRRLAEWLCANVEPLGGDLVVKTNHPSGRPWYLPSDWYLMRELSVPLLLVNADAPRGGRGAVAALNAAARSARARAIDRNVLAAAGWWTRTFGGPAHAAYVHEVPPLPLDLGIVERRAYLRRQERIARERLASRLRARPRGVAFRGHAVLGRPGRVLPKLVRTLRPAVTVMGTAARTGLPRFFVGSTAEAVIPALGTDVLVVKPGGRR